MAVMCKDFLLRILLVSFLSVTDAANDIDESRQACLTQFRLDFLSRSWNGSLPFPDNALNICWSSPPLASCEIYACSAEVHGFVSIALLLAVPIICSSRLVEQDLIRLVLEQTTPDPGLVGNVQAVQIPRPAAPVSAFQQHFGFSQLGQDVFTILATRGKLGGYFVDIGAHDGIHLSNSYLLEHFGWTGICVEPSSDFQRLARQRRCSLDTSVVASRTGEILNFHGSGVFAGASSRAELEVGPGSKSFPVATHSLNDIFRRHNAPLDIDVLSVDVEGLELEVLQGLSFNLYNVGLIVIEHAYEEPKRTNIRTLLEKEGFRLARRAPSMWDDWYFCSGRYSDDDSLFF